MLSGIHGHQDIERVVYGKPAGPALRAEAERLGARRVFVTTSKSVAQSALLADVIRELGDRYVGVYSGITAHSPRPCVIEGANKGIVVGTIHERKATPQIRDSKLKPADSFRRRAVA